MNNKYDDWLIPKQEGRGKWGFVNWADEWVIEPRFSSAGRFGNGFSEVHEGDRIGMVFLDGRVVFPECDSFSLNGFCDGLLLYRKGKSYGFFNYEFETVVSGYYAANDFSQGLTTARKVAYGNPIIIDHQGNEIGVITQSQSIGPYQDGVFRVDPASGDSLFVNKSGETVLERLENGCTIRLPTDVRFGLFGSRDEASRAWGFADLTGTIRIPAEHLVCREFSDEGISILGRFEDHQLIDTTGKIIECVECINMQDFSEGLAAAERPTDDPDRCYWGFINSKGEWVIEPQFEFAFSFENGLAYVSNDGPDNYDSGYIDQSGEWVWKGYHT